MALRYESEQKGHTRTTLITILQSSYRFGKASNSSLTGGRCGIEVIKIKNPFVTKPHTSIIQEILAIPNNTTN